MPTKSKAPEPQAELEYMPQLFDATALPDDLAHLLSNKGYAWSWQRHDHRSMPILRSIPGMRALTGQEVKKMSPQIAGKIFGETNLTSLYLEEDLIRNGDLVLFILPKSVRDQVVAHERGLRRKQQGTPDDPALDRLAEQLEALKLRGGRRVTVPDHLKKGRRSKQVAVKGAERGLEGEYMIPDENLVDDDTD